MATILERLGFNKKNEPVKVNPPEYKELGFYYNGYKENYSGIPNPRYKNRDIVWWGGDNLYPDFLIGLYKSSPIHSAIIDRKTKISCGEGITISEKSPLTPAQKLDLIRLNDYADGKQKFKNILYKISKDYHIYNQYAIKIHFDSNFDIPIKIEHLPARLIRIRANSRLEPISIIYQDDWVKPLIKEEWPIYDPTNKKDKCQVYFYYEADENRFYGEPDYASAINYINADCQIAQYYNSALENGFMPGLAFKFYFQPKTKEQKEEFRNMLRQTHQGVKKAGDPIIITWPDKETAPDIMPIPNDSVDKTLLAIVPDINEKIIAAHNGVSSLLWGVSKEGSLGNSTEIETAYRIFMKNVGNFDKEEMEDFSRFVYNKLWKLPVNISLDEYKLL